MVVEIIKGTEVKIWLDDDIVGRASSATARLENQIEEYHEIGDRDVVEIIEKNRMVSGTLERAMINGMILGKVLNKSTVAAGIYTLGIDDYQNPITIVTGESISADDTETVFELDYQPPIHGTVVIKRDAVVWGDEGVDYVMDYENGLISFASPPSSGNTWTVDYNWGRSYTITFVAQVGDGTNQRTDVEVGGVMFDTWEIPVNNTGDVVSESINFKGKVIAGLTLGTPTTGV